MLYALILFIHNLFHPSHLTIGQTDLDPVWMIWRFRKDVLDDAFRQFASTLISLQDNEHGHTRFDVCAGLSIHVYIRSYLVVE